MTLATTRLSSKGRNVIPEPRAAISPSPRYVMLSSSRREAREHAAPVVATSERGIRTEPDEGNCRGSLACP